MAVDEMGVDKIGSRQCGSITKPNKNSGEVDIAPAFGEITTACNVGQAKKGHGACLKSGQQVYARFHTHSHRCYREMYFNSRFDNYYARFHPHS